MTTPHNPEMLNLGLSGFDYGWATDVNGAGEVIGSFQQGDGPGAPEFAFHWVGGSTTVLSSLGSEGLAINENGRMFGQAAGASGTYVPCEFFLSAGPAALLSPTEWPGSYGEGANGANSSNQVVGTAFHQIYGSSAFFWDQGVAISLQPTIADAGSKALDVNDNGDVLGIVYYLGAKTKPLIWSGPNPTFDAYEIINPGGDLNAITVNAINNDKWVVGTNASGATFWYKNESGTWQGGGIVSGDPNKSPSWALDINNAGQIVGVADTDSVSLLYAFLYSPDWNENGLADAFEIRDGLVQDCNGNGIPDECEPVCVGGDVDYVGFAECLAGPGTTPPTSTTTGCGCVATFDFDGYGYVDLRDFGAFQQVSAP